MSVERIVPKEEPLPSSALELLKLTALSISSLDELAHTSLYKRRNSEASRTFTIEKARILTKLPLKLLALSESGVDVPDEVSSLASGWAKYAKKSIEDNNYLGMSVILTPMGSKKGEPNELEKLIEKLT